MQIEITQDTTPRELAEALTEVVDADDLADLVRLLRRSMPKTDAQAPDFDRRIRVLAWRTAADMLEGLTSEEAEREGVTLDRVMADQSWFEEILFGTLDNLDHPEGLELFDQSTYRVVRSEVRELLSS